MIDFIFIIVSVLYLFLKEAQNHCSPSPCVDGTCLTTPGGYYCRCLPERAGRHCEIRRLPCDSPPCDGNLLELLIFSLLVFLFFMRQINHKFSLILSIDGCFPPKSNATIQCNGHGKCETKSTGQSCSCDHGYTGLYCEYSKFLFIYSIYFQIIIHLFYFRYR